MDLITGLFMYIGSIISVLIIGLILIIKLFSDI
nr:MAG TPA: hypothetical protein [Caudoviricetes sp.]